jgi:Putative auto-transporter adhesin, head GIN domain
MKTVAYTLLFTMLVITTTFTAFAQSEETRNVSGFHSISSAGPFNVYVNINGTESLKISANADVISEIETVVDNGNLKIKFKHRDQWQHENMGKIDIYVTAKSLSGLSNAGSGKIKVDGDMDAEKVDLSLAGSGDISSAVKSGNLHISISGSGSVHINGKADKTHVSIAGSGDLLGKSLKTISASISIAGSGNVYLDADKEISASIAGSGNVVYSGNANVDSRTIGSGRVTKEN